MNEAAANAAQTFPTVTAGAAPRKARRDRSLVWSLAALCAAVALPIFLFVGGLLAESAYLERARLGAENLNAARGLAAAIDRDIVALTGTLQAVALSARIPEGDLAGFYRTATDVQVPPAALPIVVPGLVGHRPFPG